MAVGYRSLLAKTQGGAGEQTVQSVGFHSLFAKNLGSGAVGGGPSSFTLTASHGSFTLTGEDALRDFAITAERGSFALNGQAATLKMGRRLVAARGSFLLNGQPATLRKTGDYLLIAEQRTFLTTGFSVTFTVTAAPTTTNPVASIKCRAASDSIRFKGRTDKIRIRKQ